jgi:Fe-S-cluster containining protein
MVERLMANEKLLHEVAKIYAWLDMQINEKLSGKCDACGGCCDFIAFDHRLYVTVPEIMYLAANLKTDSLKPMLSGRCPYNKHGKCTVYKYRFSGCRIFNCKTNPDVQSKLSELTLGKLKAICTKYQIPYQYMELASALNGKDFT